MDAAAAVDAMLDAMSRAESASVSPGDRLVIVLRSLGNVQADEDGRTPLDYIADELREIGLRDRFVILALNDGDEVHVVRGG